MTLVCKNEPSFLNLNFKWKVWVQYNCTCRPFSRLPIKSFGLSPFEIRVWIPSTVTRITLSRSDFFEPNIPSYGSRRNVHAPVNISRGWQKVPFWSPRCTVCI